VAPAAQMVPLPPALDGRPFPGEPLGCAFNIFRRSEIRAGQTVAVVGVGFLGALLVRLAADAGARVIAVSRRPFSLEVAREMGADETVPMDDHRGVIERVKALTGGELCDRVVEAVGKQWPLDLAGELTRERGRLVIAGYHQDGPRQVNMQLWNWRGLDVVNAHERDPAVYVRGMRGGGRGGLRPAEPRSAVHAHLSAGPSRRRAGRDPRPARRLPESAGDAVSATRTGRGAGAAGDRLRRPGRAGTATAGLPGRRVDRTPRMEAVAESGHGCVAAIADPAPEMVEAALRACPDAEVADSLDAMLEMGLDGVVIATPSALHAEQSIRALEAGCAVFCQKPLGRTAAEVRRVVDAARAADRLLGVDLSYRHTEGMRRIRERIADGALGRVHAVDLVFHNAYGPDKPWFYDPALSGGGCVMDLGVHLVDLALWALDFPAVREVSSRLYAGGVALRPGSEAVEDFGVATLDLEDGAVVRLACSWNLHAGADAVISAEFYGSDGGAALRNVGGSFYDFAAHHFRGMEAEPLASPPDGWGGRAAADWAARLAAGERFDGAAERFVEVAAVLDRIYGR
jgi:predicted dehydrogenase